MFGSKRHPNFFVSAGFALLLLVIMMTTWSAGTKVMSQSIDAKDYLPLRVEKPRPGGRGSVSVAVVSTNPRPAFETKPFTIKKPTIVDIRFYAPLANSWVWLGCDLIDETGRIVHGFPISISHYNGYQGGEHWSEGSRHSNHLFRLEKAGTYRLRLVGEGGSGNGGPRSRPRRERINLTVRKGIVLQRYFLIFFAFCVVAALMTGDRPVAERDKSYWLKKRQRKQSRKVKGGSPRKADPASGTASTAAVATAAVAVTASAAQSASSTDQVDTEKSPQEESAPTSEMPPSMAKDSQSDGDLTPSALFRLVAEEACKDGKVEKAENQLLNAIASWLEIDGTEALETVKASMSRFAQGKLGSSRALSPEMLYKKTLFCVLSNQQLSGEERKIVAGLRKALRVDEDAHTRLLAEVKSALQARKTS